MTAVISNPPYNLKWKYPFFYQTQPRFDLGIPPESNANFAFIETALSQAPKAVFILPNSVLTTSNKNERAIKQNLIDKSYIKAVINLPERMFESTSIATSILVFDKGKRNYSIQMIDASKLTTQEERLQNGQFGSAAQTKRTYKKTLNVLKDDAIQKIVDVIKNDTEKTDFSKQVSNDEIKNNDYNLSPKLYLDLKEKQTKHRSEQDIVNDLNRIIHKKSAVKITINKNMAKQLGVYDLALEFKESQKLNEEIAKAVDAKIAKESIMTLTANKELKFQLTEFDGMPPIIKFFFQAWRQMIVELNNEENRLLLELKDVMLDKYF